MDRKRSIIRAGAVLAVALGAGHLVQTMTAEQPVTAGKDTLPVAVEQTAAAAETGGTTAAPVAGASVTGGIPAAASLVAPASDPATSDTAAADAPDTAAPVLAETAPRAEEPVAPAETELAALAEEPVAPLAPLAVPPLPDSPALTTDAAPDAALPGATADPAAEAAAVADCTPGLTLVPAPQAMISVTLAAPCHGDQKVILRHAGLAIAERLDAAGGLVLDLPALSVTGEVSVLFADATIARDAAPVADAAGVQRLAVQWMADDSFQIHVLEGTATYGEPGHVWADQPVSPNGGYLVSLGNPDLDLPMLAQVYTWPAGAGLPVLPTIEAVVTEATCDRELLGETIHAAAGKVTVRELSLAMPDCDALGDILVLNNPEAGVTLAAAN